MGFDILTAMHINKVEGNLCLSSRQQLTVFHNAQQCYMFRSVRPSSGINEHYLKKTHKMNLKCWNLRDLANFTILVKLEY